MTQQTPKETTAQRITMRVCKHNEAYNERRYGTPWIAVVTSWPIGKSPELQFGAYTANRGDAGDAEIAACAGDIVRWGQKDIRRPDKSEKYWGVVEADASISELTMAEARDLYNATRA